MARLNECILYRNFEHGEILEKMAELMNAWEQKSPDLKEKEGLFFECANGLVETAGLYGFSGNLWHCYLTFLMVNNEMHSARPARSEVQLREVSMNWH